MHLLLYSCIVMLDRMAKPSPSANLKDFGDADSHTSRHLAEFWMIEPEMAFCTLEDDMNCAEDYVRFCCQHLLDHCQ